MSTNNKISPHTEDCNGVKHQTNELGEGQVVMVVDDDTDLLPLVSEIVASLNFKPFLMSDAVEALNSLKENKDIKLLLTDIEMPSMNGFVLAKSAKEINPELKVVYMSSSKSKAKELEKIDPEATLLQKPFDWSNLCCALNDAFDKMLSK